MTFTRKDSTLYVTIIGRFSGSTVVVKDLRVQGTATAPADGSTVRIEAEGGDTAFVFAEPPGARFSPVIRVTGAGS